MPKIRKKRKKGIPNLVIASIIIAVVVIVVFFSWIFSASTFRSTVGSTTPIGQAISPTEPTCREVTETYREEEPYTAYLNAQIISAIHNQGLDIVKGCYEIANIKLKNIDTEASWFTVTITWKTLYRSYTDTVRHHVEPDETIDFKSTFDKKCGEDITFTYTYSSDPVTRTRWATKTRTRTVCE